MIWWQKPSGIFRALLEENKDVFDPSGIRLQVVAQKNTAYREAWERGEVVIPGLGRLRVREAGYNWPATPPKLITLTRNAAGQWHMSCICLPGELKNARKRKQELLGVPYSWGKLPLDENGSPASEGLDMSMTQLAVSNKHGPCGRTRYYKRFERMKQAASKSVSRKKKGSGRWKKAVRLGRIEVKIANARDADLRQKADEVAQRSAIVCVETLNLAGMAKTSLARSLHDLGWGKFLTYLEQAMASRGHLLIKAGAFSPTTQACSTEGCAYINRSLKQNFKTRKWDCPVCGTHHCRDTNAAENIEKDALRIFFESFGAESALLVGKLHPELFDFLARGGAASFATVDSVSESRQAKPGFVPGKRELTPLGFSGRNGKT